MPETLAFYGQAFGFPTRFLHESLQNGELDTRATTLVFATLAMGEMHFGAGYTQLSPDAAPPGVELAFVSDDVTAAYAKAIAAGALPLQMLEAKPWGQTVAYGRAQEGTLIELCSPISE